MLQRHSTTINTDDDRRTAYAQRQRLQQDRPTTLATITKPPLRRAEYIQTWRVENHMDRTHLRATAHDVLGLRLRRRPHQWASGGGSNMQDIAAPSDHAAVGFVMDMETVTWNEQEKARRSGPKPIGWALKEENQNKWEKAARQLERDWSMKWDIIHYATERSKLLPLERPHKAGRMAGKTSSIDEEYRPKIRAAATRHNADSCSTNTTRRDTRSSNNALATTTPMSYNAYEAADGGSMPCNAEDGQHPTR